MHENRETSGAPWPERERGRSAKAQSHKADAYVLEESDRAILSMNQTNKRSDLRRSLGRKGRGPRRTSFNSTLARHSAGKLSVPGIERCTRSNPLRHSSKVGAVCGKAARTVLCGGRSVMVVPTATVRHTAARPRGRFQNFPVGRGRNRVTLPGVSLEVGSTA
jgi:hypothetical protein